MPETIGIIAMAILVGVLLFVWRRQETRITNLKHERREFEGEEHRLFDFLHGLGEALYEDQPTRKMYRLIVEGVGRVVNADGGALYIANKSGKALVPVFQSKNCPPLIPVDEKISQDPKALRSYLRLTSEAMDDGLLGAVWNGRVPCLVPRLDLSPEFEGAKKGQLPENVTAMLSPLCFGDKTLGVLGVARNGANKAFSGHDFEVFKSAAEQSAFALENAVVHQQALERRRMEDDLRAASEIQKVLLPAEAPTLRNWVIAGTNFPAKIVSGDYYDFIAVDRDHHGVAIADVSGKGIPASLVMATCRSLLRMSARNEYSPSGVLKKVNRMIFSDMREDMFISMAYCLLVGSDEIVLARAGHDPPLLFRKKTGEVELLKPPGLAVGIDHGKVFDRVTKNLTLLLQPGDCLLMYTDGATDAVDSHGREEFSLARLEEVFKRSAPSGAQGILDTLAGELQTFMGSHRQMDDITLIAIEKR